MKKLALLSLVTACSLYAGGYRIPETSVNAVALGAANIAHNKSADAAYYNPANMMFMENKNVFEMDMVYIHLEKVNYKGKSVFDGFTSTNDIDSKEENFFIPNIHFVSEKIGDFRFGFSTVSSGGLSKRWSDTPGSYVSNDFTLKVIELNPSVAYSINDKLAVAFGARGVYSEGIVKYKNPMAPRDMEADSIDFGYNMALSYKPTKALEIALTYRSKVDLTEEGTTKNHGDASLSVPLAAIAAASIAYTFPTNTTVEFVYERNYWSAYKTMRINYNSGAPSTIVAKNWEDTNSFRLGITQELDDLTLMAGVVIDESPVPESTIKFETPDTDSYSLSFGGRYKINERLDIGLSALYSIRDSKTVNSSVLQGEFSDGNILILSTALGYRF